MITWIEYYDLYKIKMDCDIYIFYKFVMYNNICPNII